MSHNHVKHVFSILSQNCENYIKNQFQKRYNFTCTEKGSE